jgi:DNA polymerase elongation subunit (family B)
MQPLFLDIETIARPGAEVLLEEPQAPANYKDATKIEAYIAEAKAKQREKMALDMDCCEIVTIGVAESDLDACANASGDRFKLNERDMLARFWEYVELPMNPLVVGYNIAFDLRVLYRRSFILGIEPTVRWEYRKYQKSPVLDLMQVLYDWGDVPYRSLKHACKMCGIPEPTGDGADVGAMSPEQRIAHCKSDVEATRNLYNKGRGYYWQ